MCAKCDKGWAEVGNSRFILGILDFVYEILDFFLEILDFALEILEFPIFYGRKLDFFSLILGYLVIICAKIYF